MRIRLLTLSLPFALSLAALSGCSDSDEVPSGPDSMAESWSVLGSLETLPAAPMEEGVLVIGADLQRAADHAGVDASDGAQERFHAIASGNPTRVTAPLPGFLSTYSSRFTPITGLDPSDVTALAGLQEGSRDLFTVVSGPNLSADDLSSDLVDVGDGVLTDVDGPEGEPRLESAESSLNGIGAPTRIRSVGRSVAFTDSSQAAQAWAEDEEESLADVPRLREVAEALDERSVYASVVTDAASGAATSLGPHATEAERERFEATGAELMPSQPFDTVGLGWAMEADAPRMVVAYHFESAEDADAATARVESLWRDGNSPQGFTPYADAVTVESVSAEDSVVTVELSPVGEAPVTAVWRMLERLELPFVSR